MREFRIKVNNEKTYVVKANDYNQAVKTLHSKLRDFDDTKKNINVVREFIANNGGKFNKSKDADAILDFIYKKTGVKNADYGDVLYIIRNYTNVKVEDNAVSDSISRYTGEDAIKTNGFVKIKEDGDWTSYKYTGNNFDDAVFKIHQYNPSLIAFVSNGNRTITVRNKYLKDSSITDTDMKTAEEIIKKYGGNPVGNVMGLQKTRFVGQDEIKNQHDFATDLDKAGYKFYLINGRYRISPKDSSIKDDLTMVEKYKKSIIYIDDNGYYYHTPIGGRGAKAQRDNTKDINIVKKRIDNAYSFLYDSSIKDVSYVSGKNLKIGQKIVEDGEVLEVVDIKETQRGVNNNYRDVTFKNVKTGATETVHFGNSTLARLNDYSIKDSDSYQVWTINEKGVYHKEADVPNPQLAKAIASQLKKQGRWVQISKNSRTNIVSDCNMMDSLSIKVKLNGKTYNGIFNGISNADKTFGDVYIPELVSLHSGDKGVFNEDEGRYVSDGKFYFKLDNLKKWNPSLSNYLTDSNITDADPVKVEKIIRKEKSALGITYYIFQTKSSSGYTIYYQVTDKTYHGEPTYSGGGIISLSLKSANDTLDHNLLADKLKAKYGEKEGTKRYLRGENDSAIKDKLSTSDANSLVEAYIDKYKYTHSNLPYVNKPKIKIFNSPEEFRDKFLSSHRGYSIFAGGLLNYNGYVVKLFTSAKDGKIESPSADNIFTIFPTTAIKDSANITELTKKAKQLKNKLKKEKAHSYENWGQAEIRQLKDLFDYNNYSQSTKIINEFINWVDERTPGKIGDSNPNNIKNRKSYTIKVGDKQYKVFAESESEAINKYIKSKKQ